MGLTLPAFKVSLKPGGGINIPNNGIMFSHSVTDTSGLLKYLFHTGIENAFKLKR